MRPRWCLRCLTFLGINMASASTWLRHQHGFAPTRLFVAGAEVRGLVMLAGAPLDLLLLGEQALELGIGLTDHWRDVFGRGLGGRCGFTLGLAPTSAGGDHAPGPGLARGLPDGHRRLTCDLVLRRGAVGEDVALVDSDLY